MNPKFKRLVIAASLAIIFMSSVAITLTIIAAIVMHKGGDNPNRERHPFGVDEIAYKGALEVKSKNRPAECRELAGGCLRLASEIDGGSLRPVQPVLSAMRSEMSKMPHCWYPFFRKAADITKKLYENGKLKDNADWSQLLRECSDGLERAVKVKGTGDAGESDSEDSST
jgi:hypothetical protein